LSLAVADAKHQQQWRLLVAAGRQSRAFLISQVQGIML
jgi:hypothetical protein